MSAKGSKVWLGGMALGGAEVMDQQMRRVSRPGHASMIIKTSHKNAAITTIVMARR